MTDKQEGSVQCVVCGLVFDSEWTEEEAQAELARNFQGFKTEECEVVCEDCYQKLKPRYPS